MLIHKARASLTGLTSAEFEIAATVKLKRTPLPTSNYFDDLQRMTQAHNGKKQKITIQNVSGIQTF